MNHYTVIQPPWVDEQLAELWLASDNRAEFTAASDAIYRELGEDAENKGELVQDNLRKLAGPLWIYYTVHPDDCLVKVWSIRKAKP
jgi:hypothetical protein